MRARIRRRASSPPKVANILLKDAGAHLAAREASPAPSSTRQVWRRVPSSSRVGGVGGVGACVGGIGAAVDRGVGLVASPAPGAGARVAAAGARRPVAAGVTGVVVGAARRAPRGLAGGGPHTHSASTHEDADRAGTRPFFGALTSLPFAGLALDGEPVVAVVRGRRRVRRVRRGVVASGHVRCNQEQRGKRHVAHLLESHGRAYSTFRANHVRGTSASSPGQPTRMGTCWHSPRRRRQARDRGRPPAWTAAHRRMSLDRAPRRATRAPPI